MIGGDFGGRAVGAATTTTSYTTDAQQWTSSELKDLKPLTSTLLLLLSSSTSFAAGRLPASQLASQISISIPQFRKTILSLAGLPLLKKAPQARSLDLDGAELYLSAFGVELSSTMLPVGALQSQLELSFERIRELGDRVYDQGTMLVSPLVSTPTTNPNVRFIAPESVPRWAHLGIAPGPPLASPDYAAGVEKRHPKAPRIESVSAWALAVGRSGVPTSLIETKVLLHGSAAAASAIAARFQSAETALGRMSIKFSLKSVVDVTRLSLLVDAEASLVRGAAALTSNGQQLDREAVALALIGDSLWDYSGIGRRGIHIGGTALGATLRAASA